MLRVGLVEHSEPGSYQEFINGGRVIVKKCPVLQSIQVSFKELTKQVKNKEIP